MREAPLVSIVVPVYNGMPFVADALRSALAQTVTDLEVVVADNASTDETLAVVDELADDRVRVLPSTVNVGAGPNWNRAVRAARGVYVKLLCADDLLEPSCVERQLDAFSGVNGDRVALVGARRLVIDQHGDHVLERGFRPRLQGHVKPVRAARMVARSGSNPIGEPAAVLFRRADAVAVGLFREDAGYVIDLDFWLRLLLRGDLYVVDEVLAKFRVSAGAWSTTLVRSQAAEYCTLLGRVARDGSLGLRRGDVAVGCAKARCMAKARQSLYAWLALKARRHGV
jgi:glycosyltransferase involved in cell wall biosynthesis